jgi:hypothetical protein
MSIVDKLLGLRLVEEETETAWWTDAVHRGLAQYAADEQDIDFEDSPATSERPDKLM